MPAVFGAALSPEERRACGAEVIAVGLWDGGSTLLSALASDAGARFTFEKIETAEAVTSAVLNRIGLR